ncbi:MAG TPA: ABC transporter permease [Gemmatimonadales bacterium]|nr:ABC transporter permease [Gemmatimonadales bacterium]
MAVFQSLRFAIRSLRRSPAFTLTATLTLVIGIGASVAIFAILNGVLLRRLPYGNPERLVGAWHDLPPLSLTHTQQMAATYFTYRKHARSIEDIGVYQEGALNLAAPGSPNPRRVGAAWVSASLIPLLQVPPLRGRSFSDAEDLPKGPDVALISEGLWRAGFGGDPQIIGRSVELNGRTRQIIGVMPRRFRFPSVETEVWIPLALDPSSPGGGFNYNAIARLKPGVGVETAERDFAAVLPRIVDLGVELAPGISMQMLLDQTKPKPVLVPLREVMVGSFARTWWTVAAAAGLVLLVACFNVANLILVRADGRQRELAVREALGAGRGRVVAHFLAESATLALLACAGGLALAWAAVRALVASGASGADAVFIPRLAELSIDPAAVGFTLAIGVLVALVCGLLPALRLGRGSLETALREGGRGGTAGRTQHRVRGALVAGQIALALVVLAASGLLLRTYGRLSAVTPGFEARNVATFWLSTPRARYATPAATTRFYIQLAERAAALPGVGAVGLTSRLPLETEGMNANPYYAEGDPSNLTRVPPLQIFTTVDDGYFRAMGIPLLAGRGFEPLNRQRWDEAIISRGTAQQFYHDSTGRAAIGKRFRELPGTPWLTVVGVVGDVRDTALSAPPGGVVYFPNVASGDTLYDKSERTMALVVRSAGNPATIVAAVQRVVRELDPTLPTFGVRSMTAVLSGSMARLSLTIVILGAAAVATLLLGAVGLYGIMTYLVTLRTREVGVRIALGAEPRTVAVMFTRQGLVLTAIGVSAGLGLFLLLARFLRGLLFGVAPSDPVTLAGASLLLLSIATLASWIPARRASRVDPARTLRSE